MTELSFEWSGFRGFARATKLQVPQFTLLIGMNNVGKSSAYAPLLLLKQTLDAKSPDTALLSRGPLVDVGPYRDYVHNHDVELPVTFRVDLGRGYSIPMFRSSRIPTASAFEVSFKSDDGHSAYLSRHRLEDFDGETLINRYRESGRGAFTVTSSLLPQKLTAGRPTREITALRTELRQEQPEGFLFNGYGALMLPRQVREDSDRWAKVQSWYNAAFRLYETQSQWNNRLRTFLSDISYLGPLRSLPLRTYRLAAEAPIEVGGRGEFAPEVLYRLRDEEVAHTVNTWLTRLGYGTLKFEQLNDEYFQVLLFGSDGRSVNIADTGVGLSQVIPMLVQAVLTRPGAMFIAQQPEIHLNPAQQSSVADFLIQRASDGVRVVVESHSEHVLLRLRRRIAEGAISSKDVAVYFVEPSASGTSLRRLNLGDSGEVDREEWPSGFFEDQLSDSFALATAQALRNARVSD